MLHPLPARWGTDNGCENKSRSYCQGTITFRQQQGVQITDLPALYTHSETAHIGSWDWDPNPAAAWTGDAMGHTKRERQSQDGALESLFLGPSTNHYCTLPLRAGNCNQDLFANGFEKECDPV